MWGNALRPDGPTIRFDRERYRMEDAEEAIVLIGSSAGTAKGVPWTTARSGAPGRA